MAIEGTVDRLSIKIETQGVAEAQKQLDSLSSTLKTFRKLNEKMTGTGLEQAGKDAEDASHGIATAGEEVEVTAEKAEKSTNIFKRLAESFHNVRTSGDKTTGVFARLGDSFKKTFTHLGTFAAALKRIAMYRFLRSIIKAITAAIGEGITNIYNYSRTVGTSLAPAMDKAKSASLTFKNSIGAALAPVLEALIPVLVRVCEWLTKFNNLIAAVFASLAGKSTYTAAVDATATWGDNLSSAAGAAKELKRQLLGFDELNVLSAPSSGGGGGGGSTTPDYSNMFEERNVPNALAEWIDELKLVFHDVVLDWSELNKEQIMEKVISGIFTFCGLIFAGPTGAILGFGLSLLVNSALFDEDSPGVITRSEWEKLVEGLFGAIGGGLIGLAVGGVPGLLVGATLGFSFTTLLGTITMDEDGTKFSELLATPFGVLKYDWEKIVVPWWDNTFIPGLEGLLEKFQNTKMYKWLTGQSEDESFFAKLRDHIFGSATGKTAIPLDQQITIFSSIFDAIAADFDRSFGELFKLFDEYEDRFITAFANIIDAIDQGDWRGAWQGFKDFFATLGDFSIDLTGLFGAKTEVLPAVEKTGEEIGSAFVGGVENSVTKRAKRLGITSSKYWNAIPEGVENAIKRTNVNDPLDRIQSDIETKTKRTRSFIDVNSVGIRRKVETELANTDVVTPLTAIHTDMQREWNKIANGTATNAGAVSKTITDKLSGTNVLTPMKRIESDLGNSFNLFNSLTDTKMTQVGGTISGKLRNTDVASPMDALKSKLSEKLEEMKQTSSKQGSGIASNLTTSFNNMKSDMISAVTAVKDGVRSPFNAISSGAAKVANNVAGSVRDAVYSMNQIRFVVPSWVPGVGGQTFAFNAKTPYRDKYVPELMAEGGLVKQGQLFVARERGPELVGTYNSHTAVMNNDQIVESVSEGVYRAVVAAMGDQSTTVNIDGKTLFEIVTERNNAQVRRTGRSPLLV